MHRSIAITCLVLVGLVTGSCTLDRDKPTAPSDPNPNPPVSTVIIPVGTTKTVQPFGLEITFDTVFNDSRCPIGAICFWPGMATVRLEVATSDTDRQAVIFQINANQPAPDSSRYVVTSAGRFRIDLRHLFPYPNIDTPRPYRDYAVGLGVTPYLANEHVIGAVVPSLLPTPSLKGDDYSMDSLRISGREISMNVTYSGGCRQHQYTLFMAPPMFAESNPIQAYLYLYHYADNDFCRSVITERVTFDLQPLLDLAADWDGPIWLNVHSQSGDQWIDAGRVLYEPPEQEPPSILPLAIGNYWIYADTVWTNGVPSASVDTVEVVEYITDSLGDWWLLSQPLLTLGDRVMIKGNAIYTLQHGWISEYAEREYIPPLDTPITYQMILEGDLLYERTVYESYLAITTPAGTFDGLWGYDGIFFCAEPLHQYIKPHVGFVYSDQPSCGYGPGLTITHRTWLIEYHVQ